VICITYGVLLLLSSSWNWIYYLKLQIPSHLQFVLTKAYSFTGTIIWSVFTARLTENLIHIYTVERNQLKPYKSSDFGVHSGISLTTIATLTDYFPKATDEQESRFEIYLKVIYGGTTNKEIHFYKNRLNGNSLEMELQKIYKFDGDIAT
jgi:hypothetical protein